MDLLPKPYMPVNLSFYNQNLRHPFNVLLHTHVSRLAHVRHKKITIIIVPNIFLIESW